MVSVVIGVKKCEHISIKNFTLISEARNFLSKNNETFLMLYVYLFEFMGNIRKTKEFIRFHNYQMNGMNRRCRREEKNKTDDDILVQMSECVKAIRKKKKLNGAHAVY